MRERKKQRQRKHGEESESRFQRENNGKVEPNAVRIRAPENEGWPSARDEHPKHASQINHGRQQRAAKEERHGTATQAVQSVSRLMPGKDQIKYVDKQCRAQNALKRCPPPWTPPEPPLAFAFRQAGDRT